MRCPTLNSRKQTAHVGSTYAECWAVLIPTRVLCWGWTWRRLWRLTIPAAVDSARLTLHDGGLNPRACSHDDSSATSTRKTRRAAIACARQEPGRQRPPLVFHVRTFPPSRCGAPDRRSGVPVFFFCPEQYLPVPPSLTSFDLTASKRTFNKASGRNWERTKSNQTLDRG